MEKKILTEETRLGLQKRGLEMAVYFRDFCCKHGLRFYLCGGCCIGSLRHGGFIPWDDDVDVFMPRPDYEKLIDLWPKEADTRRYGLQLPNEKVCIRNQFVTIHCNDSTFIKAYQQDLDINHGIMMDVLPIDGCPVKGLDRKMQKLFALLYSLMVVEAAPENHGKAVNLAGRLMLLLVPGHKLRYRLAKYCEKQMSKWPFEGASFITELCSGPHYMQYAYPAACFAGQRWVEFEGEEMPIPEDAETYLSMAFGDWKTLPPEEERVIHHEFVAIQPEVPYLTHRGVLYAKGVKE